MVGTDRATHAFVSSWNQARLPGFACALRRLIGPPCAWREGRPARYRQRPYGTHLPSTDRSAADSVTAALNLPSPRPIKIDMLRAR